MQGLWGSAAPSQEAVADQHLPRSAQLDPLFQAAAKLWPDVFVTPEAEARKGELVEAMRIVRPVVETG